MTELDDNSGSSSRQERPPSYLRANEVIRNVFPAFPSERPLAIGSTRTSYVIRNGRDPRWIIPVNTRYALPVLRSWQPHKFKSRLQWQLVLLGCAQGVLSRFPGISRESAQVDASYWRSWLPGFSDEWEVVIYVGSPSHTRKVIVFFVDKTLVVKAVAKVPLYPAGKDSILAEAGILRRIHLKPALPQILFADEERGIAAQTWIQGKSISRTLREEHIELLSELGKVGGSTRLCDYRDRLGSVISESGLPIEASLLDQALDLVEDTRQLPAFIEHRDFAPWNLRRLPAGDLTLVDWEWTVEKGLPWQDICHFFYIQDYLFRGSGRVWEALTSNRLLRTYTRRFGIPADLLPGLTMHYLLRMLAADLANGEQERVRYTVGQIKALLSAQV